MLPATRFIAVWWGRCPPNPAVNFTGCDIVLCSVCLSVLSAYVDMLGAWEWLEESLAASWSQVPHIIIVYRAISSDCQQIGTGLPAIVSNAVNCCLHLHFPQGEKCFSFSCQPHFILFKLYHYLSINGYLILWIFVHLFLLVGYSDSSAAKFDIIITLRYSKDGPRFFQFIIIHSTRILIWAFKDF